VSDIQSDDQFNPESAGLGDFIARDIPPMDGESEDRDGDHQPNSMLLRLLETHSSKRILTRTSEDPGLAEHLPFPFMALVGQVEMRTALLLSVVNPNVGGVLLVGPRGIGKTTAARGVADLLPTIEVSVCEYGCMPEDYEVYGAEGVCEVCADKLERGVSITRTEPVLLIELPLNARLDDVIGGINERIAMQSGIPRLSKGILARADENLLYIDEVNLLAPEIINAILDASAQGTYTVRRGPVAATYRSRFVLIGSMNPEEGALRPQILDRFGLRVMVTGSVESSERRSIYERVRAFRQNRRAFIHQFSEETFLARVDVINARALLPEVTLSKNAVDLGLTLVQEMGIHSHRTEITLFEAARAYAALDQRKKANIADVRAVAAMAMRLRRSSFIEDFIEGQKTEERIIHELIEKHGYSN